MAPKKFLAQNVRLVSTDSNCISLIFFSIYCVFIICTYKIGNSLKILRWSSERTIAERECKKLLYSPCFRFWPQDGALIPLQSLVCKVPLQKALPFSLQDRLRMSRAWLQGSVTFLGPYSSDILCICLQTLAYLLFPLNVKLRISCLNDSPLTSRSGYFSSFVVPGKRENSRASIKETFTRHFPPTSCYSFLLPFLMMGEKYTSEARES